MPNLIYFQPRRYRTPQNKLILKFVPRDATESHKADMAEKILSEEQYVYYLALVLVHQAYNLMPKKHQDAIKNLVDAGILDDLAVSTGTKLTNCCVTMEGEFLYNDIEFKLPIGYIPRMRYIDENGDIFVEAFNGNRRRVYEFIYYKSNYRNKWKRVDNKMENLIDF